MSIYPYLIFTYLCFIPMFSTKVPYILIYLFNNVLYIPTIFPINLIFVK